MTKQEIITRTIRLELTEEEYEQVKGACPELFEKQTQSNRQRTNNPKRPPGGYGSLTAAILTFAVDKKVFSRRELLDELTRRGHDASGGQLGGTISRLVRTKKLAYTDKVGEYRILDDASPAH